MVSQSFVRDIAKELRKLIQGEVLYEEWQRAMYATDASSYEILPLAIVLPKTVEDVTALVSYCSRSAIPLTARGGGSGLAGQAIGEGIILDFTKYMNRVLELNAEGGYVVVEPGIYKGQLDTELKKYGKFLPPDPSSSEYCSIGGMIANNGSGPHTVKYGSTIDYVLSLDIVLSNGELISTRCLVVDGREWFEITGKDTLEAKAYTAVREVVEANKDLIERMTPKSRKNSSGYRLERVMEGDLLDLGKLFVCSEGTLGIVVRAKLRIIDLPQARGLVMISFPDYGDAGSAVKEILPMGPSAVEMLDRKVVELAASVYPQLLEVVPEEAKAVLLVEFDGESPDDVAERTKSLQHALYDGRYRSIQFKVANSADEMKRLWDVRRKALPFVYKMRRGEERPIAFIEDTVVDPAFLGKYISELYTILDRYGVLGVVYGHAGDGHIHIRPLLNPKSEEHIKLMEKIANEVFPVVLKYHGSITGEHGDGLARTEFIRLQYGDEVYALFRKVKRAFDPLNIFNPGKKVTDESGLVGKYLRYGPSYQRKETEPALNWAIGGNKLIRSITGYDEELPFGSEVELCHGCGLCREKSYSARMCPVFKAFQNEVDSCRGRNNLLRWMMKKSGLGSEFEFSEAYGDAVYKHCIQCKMCSIDCPSNVDVGKLMAEARARYAAVRGLPKGYQYFLDIDRYGEMGVKLTPFSNWVLQNPISRWVMELRTHISRRRRIPPFANRTFASIMAKLKQPSLDKKAVFFYDTYINYNAPDLGLKIVEMLWLNGYEAIVPLQKSSGLPALVEGAPQVGRETAAFNAMNLSPYAEKGIPIVCFSPSAGLSLKLEYLNVLDTPQSRAVADNTYDIHEFLYSLHKTGELNRDFKDLNMDANVHMHCHTIVQRVDVDVISLLSLIPGLRPRVLERGCCGVGGSFSFIKGNFEMSMQMGRELFTAVSTAQYPVYSTGESCMLQIEQGSGRDVGLTTELLASAYGI